jgi:hypothetical protein
MHVWVSEQNGAQWLAVQAPEVVIAPLEKRLREYAAGENHGLSPIHQCDLPDQGQTALWQPQQGPLRCQGHLPALKKSLYPELPLATRYQMAGE